MANIDTTRNHLRKRKIPPQSTACAIKEEDSIKI